MKGDKKGHCKRCGRLFSFGYDGICPGLCDKCAGVTRGEMDVVFLPWEDKQEFTVIATGEEITKKRPDKKAK